MQSNAAAIAAKFKLTGEVPEMPKDFIPFPKGHPELELTEYQKVALMISLNNPAYALFMEQGTGKTAIVIARICLEAARKRARDNGTGSMYRALIVCPKQVRLNWKRLCVVCLHDFYRLSRYDVGRIQTNEVGFCSGRRVS